MGGMGMAISEGSMLGHVLGLAPAMLERGGGERATNKNLLFTYGVLGINIGEKECGSFLKKFFGISLELKILV